MTPGFVDTHVHLSEHLNRGLLLDDIPVDRYLPDWLIPLYAVMTAEDEQHAPLIAIGFLGLFDAAKFASGRLPRLLRRHSATHVLVSEQLQVAAELLVRIFVEVPLSEQSE